MVSKNERKASFKYASGSIKLVFEKKVDFEPRGEFVPFFHFKIIDADGTKVGHLNFKVGDTNHIRQ